jgi:hypothetical protein
MTKKLLPLALLCAFSAGAQASIINGGFESGLNGWSTLLATDPAKVTVVSSAADYAGNAYTPTEGSAMLDLISGFPWTAIYQEFHVDEVSTLSFDWHSSGPEESFRAVSPGCGSVNPTNSLCQPRFLWEAISQESAGTNSVRKSIRAM